MRAWVQFWHVQRRREGHSVGPLVSQSVPVLRCSTLLVPEATPIPSPFPVPLQGYLSCNRFGSIIGFAHAGITAEGDNRVLFTKVAKELTASLHVPEVKARLEAGRKPPAITVAR